MDAPALAMILVRPLWIALIKPRPLTVAVWLSRLDHATAADTTTFPRASRATAVATSESLTTSSALSGDTDTDATRSFTPVGSPQVDIRRANPRDTATIKMAGAPDLLGEIQLLSASRRDEGPVFDRGDMMGSSPSWSNARMSDSVVSL